MATTDIFEDPFKNNQNGLLSSQAASPSQPAVTASTPAPQPETTKTTTANQDLTSGSLELRSDGAYFTPASSGTTEKPEETVGGRLSGLLASESPYLTAAKTRAKQESNSRGLLNSTMAATAGEKAAIESALPIATSDASFAAQRRLQGEQGEIQKGLYETQGEISSKLSKQSHEQDMTKQEADIAWKKIDLQARMDVEMARLDQEKQKMFNDTILSISADFQRDYKEIASNPVFNYEGLQTALNILTETTRERYRLAGEIAGVSLNWTVPSGPVPLQK